MIVDAHTHLLPRSLPDLAGRFGLARLPAFQPLPSDGVRIVVDGQVFRDVGANCYDPEVRLADCDRLGVDVQVISTVPVMFSYWAPPQVGIEVARHLNDDLAEAVRRYPTRFIGLGTLPLQAPEAAVTELVRCRKELGLAGVEIGSHVNDWNLDAAELFSVFEAAADLEAAVFIHPWDMLAPERLSSYWMAWLVGMPTEQTVALCSLILGGVLERLPGLRVCLAHGGGSFFGTLGRIARGFEARPDLVATRNDRPPSAYLGRFWVDSLVHDPELLRLIGRQIGQAKILLGTDYPFPLGEARPGAALAAAFPGESQANLWDHTFAWLGCSPP